MLPTSASCTPQQCALTLALGKCIWEASLGGGEAMGPPASSQHSLLAMEMLLPGLEPKWQLTNLFLRLNVSTSSGGSPSHPRRESKIQEMLFLFPQRGDRKPGISMGSPIVVQQGSSRMDQHVLTEHGAPGAPMKQQFKGWVGLKCSSW